PGRTPDGFEVVVLTAGPAPLATVPDVVGSTQLLAVVALAAARLGISPRDSVFPDAPRGTVVRQDPPAGARVPRGTVVRVVIAHGRSVTVPSLAELTPDRARAVLADSGLELGRIDSARTRRTAGAIVSQQPRAGARAEVGSSVRVQVARGTPPPPPPPPQSVPDLTGMTPVSAAAALGGVEMVLGRVDHAVSSAQPMGMIVGQNPAPGTPARPRGAVSVTVASTVDTVQVPDLTGLTLARATRLLASRGLRAGSVSRRESPGDPGNVLGQSIAPRLFVFRGTQIDLVVSAPILVTVPPVTRRPLAEAQAALTAVGLTGIVGSGSGDDLRRLVVASQRPAAGVRVPRGSRVRLTLAPLLTSVPDVSGRTAAAARALLADSQLVAAFAPGASPDDARWTVGSQRPAAGARVPPGSTVELIPSGTVPNVTGLSLPEARHTLATVGLAAVVEVPPGDSAAARVAAQEPLPGTPIGAGASVTLTLAASPHLRVPKVTGLSIGAARAALSAAGLRVGGVDGRTDRPWQRVKSQLPVAGSLAARGSTVRLEVGIPFVLVLATLALVLFVAATGITAHRLWPRPRVRSAGAAAPRVAASGRVVGTSGASVRMAGGQSAAVTAAPVFLGPQVRIHLLPGESASAQLGDGPLTGAVTPLTAGEENEPGHPPTTPR
ncbi:MAG: PASTA domain-containing protein, partial [Longimicrobiaceae bacterium]